MEALHTPVMSREVLDLLSPSAGDIVVDATLGEGGHAEVILSECPGVSVIGLDIDKTMQERATVRLAEYAGRVTFRCQWFDDYFTHKDTCSRPQGILADLGLSLFHYERGGRGFSFRGDEPLDMRLDSHQSLSASDIVNEWSEKELADLFYSYGQERFSYRIGRAICQAREKKRVESTGELVRLILKAYPAAARRGRLHPATRSFQALRMAVNQEPERLDRFLEGAFEHLSPGGRMVLISFHSLEDGKVKRYWRQKSEKGLCRLLTKKPLVPTKKERHLNPASRSAKLRAIEKSASLTEGSPLP